MLILSQQLSLQFLQYKPLLLNAKPQGDVTKTCWYMQKHVTASVKKILCIMSSETGGKATLLQSVVVIG